MKPDKDLEQRIRAIAALDDPVRRDLYLYVGRREGEVGRAEAARALRISRALAAFHLDRLAEAGLLEVSYRRLSGRSGPGAGRPSKLYRVGPRPIELTLPSRRYQLAAQLLVESMAAGGTVESLETVARSWGRRAGLEARERAGARAAATALQRAVLETLRDAGFDPHREPGGDVVLRNCPFSELRSVAPPTICRMNVALCRGLIEGSEARGWTVRLEPAPHRCCAVFHTVGAPAS